MQTVSANSELTVSELLNNVELTVKASLHSPFTWLLIFVVFYIFFLMPRRP